MWKRFAQISALLAVGVMPGYGQEKTDSWMMVALVKSAGPYEVKGESGVIGFVVAWAGDSVTFKPCTGDSFSLDRKRLVSTKNKCTNSPPPDEHPLVASCDEFLKGWDIKTVVAAVQDDGPIGKTFVKKPGDAQVTTVMADSAQAAATVDAGYQLKDCGQYTVGFDKMGIAKFGLIPSTQAMQLNYQ